MKKLACPLIALATIFYAYSTASADFNTTRSNKDSNVLEATPTPSPTPEASATPKYRVLPAANNVPSR